MLSVNTTLTIGLSSKYPNVAGTSNSVPSGFAPCTDTLAEGRFPGTAFAPNINLNRSVSPTSPSERYTASGAAPACMLRL